MKTSELTGAALDWAVSVALGHTPVYNMDSHGRIWAGWWERTPKTRNGEYRELKRYSTDWAQGGPIIEREDIAISPLPDGLCRAYAADETMWAPHGVEVFKWKYKQQGYHPLIAAMRCYVAKKLGDEVDVPEELT